MESRRPGKVRVLKQLAVTVAAVFVALMSVQALYQRVVKNEEIVALQAIRNLFRDKYRGHDPYEISQAISDFNSFPLIKCTKLKRIFKDEQRRVFVDLAYQAECVPSFITFAGVWSDATITSINGDRWKVRFFLETSSNQKTLFWLIRAFSVVIVILVSYAWYRAIREERLRAERDLALERAEAAKDRAISSAAVMVAHDLRSPLHVLQNIVEKSATAEDREHADRATGRILTMMQAFRNSEADRIVRPSPYKLDFEALIAELKTYAPTVQFVLNRQVEALKFRLDGPKTGKRLIIAMFSI